MIQLNVKIRWQLNGRRMRLSSRILKKATSVSRKMPREITPYYGVVTSGWEGCSAHLVEKHPDFFIQQVPPESGTSDI
jgi:hypothetical protein